MAMKKKESKASPKKQKSRAKYQCPSELEDLIYQVNLIPPDFQMQSLLFLLGDRQIKLTITDALKDCLKYTPLKFQEHIEFISGYDKVKAETEEATRKFYVQKMANAYIEYFEMRNSMLWLVQRLETERANPNTFFDWVGFPLVLRAIVVRNAVGKLQEIGLAALIGKFDDSRLRICEICQRIYWAKRENSKTCSPQCLNKLNVRRHRALTDEEKAEKKAQREANSRRNKKLKEIRSKK